MTKFTPITHLDHVAPPNCPDGMCCKICMQRCYSDFPGHLFNSEDGMTPCECGQFKNILEAQEFWKKAE